MKLLTLFLLSTFCLAMLTNLQAQDLKQGERIIFLGDSITEAGAEPGGYVSIVRDAINKSKPDAKIEVIGAGISGHKVPDLQRRLKSDVLDKNPTLVVIYIGINDVWHSQSGKGTSKEDFESGLKDIIKQINDAGSRVILTTASVIGEKHDGSNKLDEMLDEYCEISRKVSTETDSQLLDLRKLFMDYLKENNPEGKASKILTTDGVHLNEKGNKFVAHQMLHALMPDAKQRVLRHVVLFKFNDGLEEEKIAEVVAEFGKLQNKIESIMEYEFGTDVSPENLSQGFTHCFMVTFENEADRDAYLPHPAHKEFVEFIGGKIDQVLVVDFWSN